LLKTNHMVTTAVRLLGLVWIPGLVTGRVKKIETSQKILGQVPGEEVRTFRAPEGHCEKKKNFVHHGERRRPTLQ